MIAATSFESPCRPLLLNLLCEKGSEGHDIQKVGPLYHS